MKLAGKYATGYTPDMFPNQQLMHTLARQTTNAELQDALLRFQYPFRLADLQGSNYSQEVKQAVLNATSGGMS